MRDLPSHAPNHFGCSNRKLQVFLSSWLTDNPQGRGLETLGESMSHSRARRGVPEFIGATSAPGAHRTGSSARECAKGQSESEPLHAPPFTTAARTANRGHSFRRLCHSMFASQGLPSLPCFLALSLPQRGCFSTFVLTTAPSGTGPI